MSYEPSRADRAPLPESFFDEPRYLKYRAVDLEKPYARFFTGGTRRVQKHVQRALVAGMSPAEMGYGLEDAADRLAGDGYDDLETGWTRLRSGVVMVAVLTDMPGVTAPMWDWWFGWHSVESARYKLWHPDAHVFTTIGEDRSQDPDLSDVERYVGNVSYVDEYIGGVMQTLAIRFVDPSVLGLARREQTTHICARVTSSRLPVAIGWLIHQVRPTNAGSEMRSRFFLNMPEILRLPARSLPRTPEARLLSTGIARAGAQPLLSKVLPRVAPAALGTDMIFHCAAEMNHLAGFLPELYREFGRTT